MSVTKSQDYYSELWRIQSNTPTTRALLLPKEEKIYEVDLNKRTIEVPEFLSVAQDHQSETIYFKFDRYFGNVDLTTKVCIIQYKNAAPTNSKGVAMTTQTVTDENGKETTEIVYLKNQYVYPVPYYDVEKYYATNKVLIPWCIQGPATEYAGKIEFSIRFYQLDKDGNLIFDLNTLPATGIILSGQSWELNEFAQSDFTFDDTFIQTLQNIKNASDGLKFYWTDV